jgi:hypothetical protein
MVHLRKFCYNPDLSFNIINRVHNPIDDNYNGTKIDYPNMVGILSLVLVQFEYRRNRLLIVNSLHDHYLLYY